MILSYMEQICLTVLSLVNHPYWYGRAMEFCLSALTAVGLNYLLVYMYSLQNGGVTAAIKMVVQIVELNYIYVSYLSRDHYVKILI